MSKVTELQKSEKNDCVVRSIQNAYGITYNQAHAFCKDSMERTDKKGVNPEKWIGAIKDNSLFGKKAKEIGETVNGVFGLFTHYENVKTKTEIVCKMSVGTFLEQYPKGTYILGVRGHAFVVKDGEVLGNEDDKKKKRVIVLRAFQVLEEKIKMAAKS